MKKLTILAALCAAISAHAAEATPQAALDQFLKFELDGGRLHNDTEGYYEQVHLVDSWKTDAVNCEGARCKATVTFTYTDDDSDGSSDRAPSMSRMRCSSPSSEASSRSRALALNE